MLPKWTQEQQGVNEVIEKYQKALELALSFVEKVYAQPYSDDLDLEAQTVIAQIHALGGEE